MWKKYVHLVTISKGMECVFLLVAQQNCFDAVNVHQRGSDSINTQGQVIVPLSSFSCSGRVTRHMISLVRLRTDNFGFFPSIQQFCPSGAGTYGAIYQYSLRLNYITDMGDYHLANVTFTGNLRIEFQPGDVIGYYLPSSLLYAIWNVEAPGYTTYSISSNNPVGLVSTKSVTSIVSNRRPLLQAIFGKFVCHVCT